MMLLSRTAPRPSPVVPEVRGPQTTLLEGHENRTSRLRPRGPVVRTVCPEADLPVRYTLSSVWIPNRRQLGWLTYRPVTDRSKTFDRITRWTYRQGYGGFMLTNLYPNLTETRAELHTLRADGAPVVGDLLTGAFCAGGLARQWQIRTLVLVTGDLDAVAETAFVEWLKAFRERCRVNWACCGITAAGWPVSLATSGRTPLDDAVEIRRWHYPAPERPKKPLLTRKVEPQTEAA